MGCWGVQACLLCLSPVANIPIHHGDGVWVTHSHYVCKCVWWLLCLQTPAAHLWIHQPTTLTNKHWPAVFVWKQSQLFVCGIFGVGLFTRILAFGDVDRLAHPSGPFLNCMPNSSLFLRAKLVTLILARLWQVWIIVPVIRRRFIVIYIGEASEVFRLKKLGVCHYILTLNTS